MASSLPRPDAFGPCDLFFTRTGAEGRPEFLVLLGSPCPEPECPCRRIPYYGYLVTERECLERKRNLGPRVLDVHLDVDTRKLDPASGDQECLSWLQSELPGLDLDGLRTAFEEVRAETRKEYADAWRTVDWSQAKEGMKVSWNEAHPGYSIQPVEHGDRTFVPFEYYCSSPQCPCNEVTVEMLEVVHGKQIEPPLFTVNFHLDASGEPRLDCLPQNAALAKAVWSAWPGKDRARLAERQRIIGSTVGVALQHRSTPFTRASLVQPNQLCPCGSGKKYKRCCLGRG